jgi:superoxide dismutase, Fe-Mn family
MTMTRRQLLSSTSAVALAGLAAPALAAPARKRRPSPPPRAAVGIAPGKHAVAKLPFDPTTLPGLSERLLVSHHDKNYAGAVKNLNQVELELGQLGKDAPGYRVAALRERELVYTNSVILHEHYFGNLGGDGKRSGALDRELASGFGSVGRFEEQFRAAALALGGGSGWVVLALNFQSQDLRIYGSGNHSQAVAAGTPLLVLDMYEHAYALDHGAGHAAYVEAFFANLKWQAVERRLEGARNALRALAG